MKIHQKSLNPFSILLILLCIAFTVNGQKATVNGKVIGNCSTIYLLNNQQNSTIMDSAKVDKSGGFKFTFQVEQPDFFVLQLAEGEEKTNLNLLLHPKQTITVEIEKKGTLVAYKSVKGSEDMQQLKEAFDILNAQNEELSRLREEYQAVTSDKPRIEQEYAQIVNRLFAQINTKILAKKELLANALLVGILDFNAYFDTYKIIAQTLSAKYPNNSAVQGISQQVAQAGATRIGAEAPDIELADPQGNIRKLSSLRGKYVLIDFWASWCGPCRKENPYVVNVYKKYNPLGFEIFSVSLDKDENGWKNAIKNDGLIWENHVSDLKGWSSSAAALYGVRGIPHTVLIDKEGKIMEIGLRGDALSQKLMQIFGE